MGFFSPAGGQVLSDTGLPDALHKAEKTPRRRCVVLQVLGVENLSEAVILMERNFGM